MSISKPFVSRPIDVQVSLCGIMLLTKGLIHFVWLFKKKKLKNYFVISSAVLATATALSGESNGNVKMHNQRIEFIGNESWGRQRGLAIY